MYGSLKVRQLVFSEQGVSFVVQRIKDSKYFQCPVIELFKSDWLLRDFNVADIRLISYFAAIEEESLDRAFLKKLHQV